MTRPLRIAYPNAFYHILNRGNNRQNIFLNGEEDMNLYIEVLNNAKKYYGIRIVSYCLMHNHYHLLIQTPRGNISKVMQYIGGVYTTKMNALHKRDGHLFRGRFKSILVKEADYLRNIIRYIHLNPVKAQLVKDPFNWDYSSHKDYLNIFKDDNYNSILHKRLCRQLFAYDLNNYLEFLQEGVDKITHDFYAKKKIKPIFGSDEFVSSIKQHIPLPKEEVDCHREYKQSRVLPQVLDNVSLAFGTTWKDLCSSKRSQHNYARALPPIFHTVDK